MNELIFPKDSGQRYWRTHYLYVLNLFKAMDYKITLKEIPEMILSNSQSYKSREELYKEHHYTPEHNAFECYVNGKKIIIDFGDSGNSINKADCPIFKFHYRDEHRDLKNVYPFAPISFYDWNRYDKILEQIEYKAEGLITSRQRPYAAAYDRRNTVQAMLKKEYGEKFKSEMLQQDDFFFDINNILVSVCVPGYCNNMLDRAQWQYMAFGCCTISPELPEILMCDKKLIPDIHYIKCADDYSDLINIINDLKKEKAIAVGNNAQNFFKMFGMFRDNVLFVERILNEV